MTTIGPWRITFDTNPDLCNLRCVMCELHESARPADATAVMQASRVMDPDVVRRVVAETATLGLQELIPSTMGEPLLYEHFDVFLDCCRRYGLALNLTTNGSFPRRGVSGWAQEILEVASDIKVSWNGAGKSVYERVMCGASWEQALSNLHELVRTRSELRKAGRTRCSLTLQMTFLDANYEDLPGVIELARELGIDRVKGHHVWVHSPALAGQSLLRNEDSRRRWNDVVVKAHAAAGRRPGDAHPGLRLDNIAPVARESRDEASGACPFLGREAWIDASGEFHPCCAPSEKRRKLGSFGSVTRTGLMSIWNCGSYRSLVSASLLSRVPCLECPLRRPDQEGG